MVKLSQIVDDPIYVIVTKGGNWSSGRIGEAFRVTKLVLYSSGFKAYVDVDGTECGLWMEDYRFPKDLDEYKEIKEAELPRYNEIAKLQQQADKLTKEHSGIVEKINKLKEKKK